MTAHQAPAGGAANPTVLAAFDELAERLARPESWTQGVHARNVRGFEVRYGDPDACSWCLDGAVMLLSCDVPIARALRSIEPQYITWNDTPGRTHPEVLALIAAARAAYVAGGGQ